MLGSAMRLFREHGYAGVSLRQLESATGLHATSLYKAYGSKDGLFRAALEQYNREVVRHRVCTHLEREDAPLAGIRAYFTSVFAAGKSRDPGCLLTNTAVESYSIGEAAGTGVAAGLRAIQDGLEAALERARLKREIDASVVPGRVAPQLLAFYQGVLVLVRSGMSARQLEALVDGALDSLVKPRQKPRQKRRKS